MLVLPVLAMADTNILIDNGNDALDPVRLRRTITVLIQLVDATPRDDQTFDALSPGP